MNPLTTMDPLDAIENALITASNTLNDMDDAKRLCVYGTLDDAIDAALRIVQAWKEENENPPRRGDEAP